jgi:hypothetical protein
MIVLRAIVNATRQLKPHLAAAAFPGGGPQMQGPGAGPAQPPGPPPQSSEFEAMSGHATWVRQGNTLTFTL